MNMSLLILKFEFISLNKRCSNDLDFLFDIFFATQYIATSFT